MAIQTINLTVPGGDTPRSANTKINANFSDATHAASKLVGTANGQIPLAQDAFKAASTMLDGFYTTATAGNDCNNFAAGTRYYGNSSMLNSPLNDWQNHWLIETKSIGSTSNLVQIAYNYLNGTQQIRACSGGVWSAWRAISTSVRTYLTTTAAGANVVVSESGELQRSTSSERYKDIIAPLELDDARYADAMSLKPIVYRSTADADNPAYHYYSFSAEELGTYDPAFTLWRETETVTNEDGNVTEQSLAERQAEGININALLAMGHAIAIKQGELIKDLQEQVIEQKEAIAALKQTNP